jgi:hypothetical protein
MQIHPIIGPRIESGTADGQLLFWVNAAKQWKKLETSEAIWDDTNKRMGLNQANPTSTLDVNETVTVKRLLAGGVNEG